MFRRMLAGLGAVVSAVTLVAVAGVAADGPDVGCCAEPPAGELVGNAAGLWVSDQNGLRLFAAREVAAGGAGVRELGAFPQVPADARIVSPGDGATFVWAARGGSLWRVHADGRIERTRLPPKARGGVLLAADAKAAWLTRPLGKIIHRVRADGTVVRTVAVRTGITAAVPVADALWVTATGPLTTRRGRLRGRERGTLSELRPRAAVASRTRIAVGRMPWAAAHGHGRIWVLNYQDRSATIVDAKKRMTTMVIGTGTMAPRALAVDGGGAWVIGDGSRVVMRLEQVGDEMAVTRRVALPGNTTPLSIARAGGAVWVLDSAGALVRIDGLAPR